MEDLVLNNIGLIATAIKQLNIYCSNEEVYNEYFDYGMEGLIRGAKSYDKSKGIAESTYLMTCIKNQIIQHFYEKTRKKRYNIYGEISLDDDFGDKINLHEIIPNDVNVEEQVIRNIRFKQILKLMDKIKNKNYVKVVKMYYGIGYRPKTDLEISKELGVSRTRVSNMRKACIRKIRKLAKEEDI